MIPRDAVFVRCGECNAATEHQVRRDFETMAPAVAESAAWQGDTFVPTFAQILQCLRCGSICFRCGWSERSQPHVVYWTIYINPQPARIAPDRLPENVGKLYRETVEAIRAGCLTLAAAGMRAAVEGVCQQNGCTGSDLQDRIRNLRANHVVSGREANALHAHRVFGNDALHHMKTPSLEEVLDALGMLDHVLATVYQLPHRTDNLLRRRDARLQGNAVPASERVTRAG